LIIGCEQCPRSRPAIRGGFLPGGERAVFCGMSLVFS